MQVSQPVRSRLCLAHSRKSQLSADDGYKGPTEVLIAQGGDRPGSVLTEGVYADIILSTEPGVLLNESCKAVAKVVSAPADGHDPSRLPHNIVLEAKVLAACVHPNIIQLVAYDFDSATCMHRLTLPWLQLTLSALLEQLQTENDNDEIELFRSIAFQCLQGLSCLHKQGIAHRDINPHNILLHHNGTVKLIDFSTAYAPHIWQTGEQGDRMICQVGTGPYRAPELLFGPTHYNPRAIDLWSLGVVLADFFVPNDGNRTNQEAEPLEDPPTSDQTGRRTLFDATFGDIGLGASIFRIRGTPNYSWPGFLDLPDASKVMFDDHPPSSLADHLPGLRDLPMADGVLELIEGLLALSPSARVSCADALHLPLFTRPVLVPLGYPLSEHRTTTELEGLTLSAAFRPLVETSRMNLERRVGR